MSVSEEDHLSILIINDFPTFETKYLKNYLSDQGHTIAIKSQITQRRYKYEYFNTNDPLNTDLSKKNLELFDLLIIDVTSLNKLSKSIKNTIKDVVNNYGLGVYIQGDPTLFRLKKNLGTFKFTKNSFTSIKLDPKLQNINVFPFDFKNAISFQPIHTYKTKIITAYKQLGLGKIGTSAIKNSYELVLKGANSTYQAIWAEIIETISKKNITKATWNSNSHIAFQNEPFNFTLATQIVNPSLTNRDSLKFALKQNIAIPTLWEGITYPKKTGWHSLYVNNESTKPIEFYVTDSTKWRALKAYKTIKDNKLYFERHQELKKSGAKSAETINLNWLFAIFILSVGYLWLEPKL